MLDFWAGHKTHILAIATMLISGAYAMDWLTQQQYFALIGMLGGGGLSTLRHGMHTENAAIQAQVGQVSQQVAQVDASVQQDVLPAVDKAVQQTR